MLVVDLGKWMNKILIDWGIDANAGWEETLDLILDFLTPVWSAFCNDEIFYDDWMPELGRFMG